MGNSSVTDRAVESIVKQFRGGEHRLAGMRASELVYGKSRDANSDLVDRLKEEAPGIERYISSPEVPVQVVSDQGGDPLAKQPENDPEQNNRTNLSDDEAKDEQKAIDDKLKPGRERREKADVDGKTSSTKLNPEA